MCALAQMVAPLCPLPMSLSPSFPQDETGRPGPIDALRGEWATRPLIFCLLALCAAAMWGAAGRLLIGSDGRIDGLGRLLGPDFSAIWGAGQAALSGEFSRTYGLDWFSGHLRNVFGEKAYVLAWSYPPVLYALAMPLAALPYGAALGIWLGASYFALVALAHHIIGHRLVWIAALAYPGLYANSVQGQSGFLVAALLAGGLLALEKRPVLAGVLFSLLIVKPQFGILLPVALIAAGRWRAFMAAAVSGCALVAASALVFGPESWFAFLNGLSEARHNALDRGAMGYYILQSLFGILRQNGLPLNVAYGAQALLAIGVAIGIWRLWRSDNDRNLKYAALIVGSLLISPYCMDYDLVLLAPAIAFALRSGWEKGFAHWEQTAMALAFVCAPLARFSTFFLGFPLGLFGAGLLFTILLCKGSQDRPGHS